METSQTTVLKLSTRNNKYQKPLNTTGMFANMLKGERFLPFLCEKQTCERLIQNTFLACGIHEHTQQVHTLMTGILFWEGDNLGLPRSQKLRKLRKSGRQCGFLFEYFPHKSQDFYPGAGVMGCHGRAAGSKIYIKNTHYFVLYVNLSIVRHNP